MSNGQPYKAKGSTACISPVTVFPLFNAELPYTQNLGGPLDRQKLVKPCQFVSSLGCQIAKF